MFKITDIQFQKNYDYIVTELRRFFKQKGYTEVYCQGSRTILAACEDPETVAQYIFGGINYPLPQTGQMNLESILLKNPNDIEKIFCMTTSYRNEPFPINGRHDLLFPMFEFELHGNINDLRKLEMDLVYYLGFGDSLSLNYEDVCERYDITEVSADIETKLQTDYGNVISLEMFPQRSHPFWNMKQYDKTLFNKIDVILCGMETIGSAERSVNVNEMQKNFYSVSGGNYAKLLFSLFTEERVKRELDEYLSLKMFPRFGGGIGITRMERAMKIAEILK